VKSAAGIRSFGHNTFSFLHSHFSFSVSRKGFTALEVMLVIGVLGGLAAYVTPAYRDYQIRSDLYNAAEMLTQAIGRAQLRGQAGEHDLPWGFSVSHNVMFAGETYATRNPLYDERYQIPDTVAHSGLDEVSFARLTGDPSATGTIILTSLRNEQREVNIIIDRQGIVINPDDRVTLCHCAAGTPQTMRLPESAWPAHGRHGDYLGRCHVPNPADDCKVK
jgi:prepilin-type N-terminal cleavage/methylation domain-containing protein